VRINKFLAMSQIGSRRKVEEFILNGDIKINNEICTDLSRQIDPDRDIVQYKNKRVKPDVQKTLIVMNKPKNYIVTKSDEFDRKTIYDLLPDFAKSLNPVGRLDYASEGLLILTNDGDLANKIIHPQFKLPKTYVVSVDAMLNEEELNQLRNGIMLDDRPTLPAKVYMKKVADKNCEIKMTIFEGRNRQIRRMIEALGHQVTKLKRIQIGEIHLENLPVGMWRSLTPEEVLYLVKHTQHAKRENHQVKTQHAVTESNLVHHPKQTQPKQKTFKPTKMNNKSVRTQK